MKKKQTETQLWTAITDPLADRAPRSLQRQMTRQVRPVGGEHSGPGCDIKGLGSAPGRPRGRRVRGQALLRPTTGACARVLSAVK